MKFLKRFLSNYHTCDFFLSTSRMLFGVCALAHFDDRSMMKRFGFKWDSENKHWMKIFTEENYDKFLSRNYDFISIIDVYEIEEMNECLIED